MTTLRAGVIGLGGMGRNHVIGFRRHPSVEVTAAADPDEAAHERIRAECGVEAFYTDAEEMLKQEPLDIVAVATPNSLHKPMTLAALAAGAHVFCEKPMAMNADEARAMRDAARAAGRRIMINFSFRFSEEAQALSRRVAAGDLGEIYFGRSVWHRRRGLPGFGGWFGQKALSGGGPLIDLGVHRLDLALWLMGYPEPEWVMGATYDPIARAAADRAGKAYDVEDLAVACIRFANGATLVLEASWAANIAEDQLMETRLYGARGGLVHRNVGGAYRYEAELYLERDGDQYDMKLHPSGGCDGRGSMRHFADSILADTPHIATADEGVTVMELLDAIYESARKGAPVRAGG